MPNTAPKLVHVAVGVICRGSQVLISLRPQNTHMGGLWEFPGGKVEASESVELALVRELKEELDIVAERFDPLIEIKHDYSDKQVLLDVWLVSNFSGTPYGKEGQEMRWVDRTDLDNYAFPEANKAIVALLLTT